LRGGRGLHRLLVQEVLKLLIQPIHCKESKRLLVCFARIPRAKQYRLFGINVFVDNGIKCAVITLDDFKQSSVSQRFSWENNSIFHDLRNLSYGVRDFTPFTCYTDFFIICVTSKSHIGAIRLHEFYYFFISYSGWKYENLFFFYRIIAVENDWKHNKHCFHFRLCLRLRREIFHTVHFLHRLFYYLWGVRQVESGAKNGILAFWGIRKKNPSRFWFAGRELFLVDCVYFFERIFVKVVFFVFEEDFYFFFLNFKSLAFWKIQVKSGRFAPAVRFHLN